MKRYFLGICTLFASFYGYAQKDSHTDRPKLVVGLVIDQMRWDYLYRYAENYGNRGFKRMMHKGFNCQNTSINYLPSFTAPGHSCVYTGSVPSIHGMAANDWIDNFTEKKVYCVDDNSVKNIVDGDTVRSQPMSPRNLLTTTITDELRLATNFGSKVYGVAIKDRSSILPAGHLANGAYWMDDSSGSFGSSSYYKKHNSPNWLEAFNKRRVPDSLINLGWNLLDKTGSIYTQSTPDNSPYEGNFKGETSPVFPHSIKGLSGKEKYNAFKATPGGNTATLMLAKACLEGAHLGQGRFTDFLCVSLSSTDYAGHQFGPNALEMEDMYIRLDRELGEFLDYLDERIGKGQYVIFLTADHGGAHNPQFLIDNNVPAGGLPAKEIKSGLATYLNTIYGTDSLVTAFTNYQFYLNENLITARKLDRSKIRESAMYWLNRRSDMQYAIDMEHVDHTPLPEPLRTMVINGYNRGRSGSIQVIPNPGWFEGHGKTGTTHGTWNPYDVHIPLLWYGWNIPAGETHNEVHMTDISATLAALLNIQAPNGCIGKPIKEIVR